MSAVTQNNFTGNNSTTTYSFTFPYLKTSDIKASLDGVETTAFTLPNATTLQFNTAPGSGVKIKIFRETGVDDLTATFYAGSAIKSEDLNDNFTQNLYKTQEVGQRAISSLGGTMTGDLNLGEDASITFEGATDDAHETRLTVADPTIDRTITLPNVTGTVVTTGDTGTVSHGMVAGDAIDGDNIADNSINSEHYVDGSIDTAHIADLQVTTPKLANTSVTTAKLDNNAVTSAKILNANVITAKLADANVTTAKLADDSVTAAKLATGAVDANALGAASVNTANIVDTAISTAKIATNAVTDTEIATGTLDNRYFTETELTGGALDGRYFTETESDARYFNISSGDTIKDGDTFPDNDTTIATTAAINDRIIDLVDDVGGFVPIASETNFPTTNPDVNNGSGTLVSIKAIGSTRTPSSGTVTIANGSGSNTVTITGCGSTVLTAGFGVIVETTSTLHTYAFHRLVPKATEVTTVAGNITNINAVANNATNITSVADNATNINAVQSNATNINTVAGINANVTTVAGNNANVTTVAGSIANVNTVGGAIANVNTTAGSITNVNAVATNIADVNNFADTYQIASSNPSTRADSSSLQEGDLYFNTTANELKVYNGSAWQGGVTATGNFAVTTGNTFTGDNIYQDNAKLKLGTGSDLEIFHNASDSIINDAGTGNLKLQTGGSTKLEITSTGATITGNIAVTGNVDGRDLAADGTKLDGGIMLADGDKGDITVSSSGATFTIDNNAVTTAKITDANVTTAKIADLNVTTGKIADDAITNDKIGADAVDHTEIADNAVRSEHITTNAVTALEIANATIIEGNIADDAVTADKLANSINTEIAANTAKVTNATHTGEVTGSTSLTIADDVVDEANLKVSNSPTNGYVLTAQSGNTGGLTWAAAAGGGAFEYVDKTTLTSSAAYIDFTGLDDNSIYVFYGKKVKFDASTWTTFSFLDGSGASGNRQVAYIRSATYSSGGGSGSVSTYGNSPETNPNTWPGGSTTLMSFRLEVGTSATNNFFLYKVVAVKDSTTVRMGYGETTGSLATTSSTDRIHGVRFDVNNSGVNYDVGTEILVYKLKES